MADGGAGAAGFDYTDMGRGGGGAEGGPLGADPGAVWARAAAPLKARVGAGSFQSWIAPLRLVSVEGGVATLATPTAFLGSYVARNFTDAVLQALGAAGAPAHRLAFVSARAAEAQAARAAAAPASTPAPEAGRDAGRDGEPRLDPRLTFERFVAGRPNELALAAARRVAEGDASFNPLVLHGGVGVGKTHLLQAIAHDLRARRPDLRVLYLSAEQFMLRFVTSLRERKMMEFKQGFRALDVLLVDDIQFIAGKDSTQEEFFHTFNALVDAGKRIVLACDRAPAEIASMEERVASRLQAGLVAAMHPADAELRLAVLRVKLAHARAADPSLRVAEGVLEFLAGRVTSNLRVLEGALTRLCAQGSLVKREVTVELARDTLGDVLRAADRRVSVEEIQRRVAEHYRIRVADLTGPRRLKNLARPRQVAMFLAKTMTSRSLPDIGRRFGGRDHTTVMHGVRRIEELRVSDAQIADDLDALRRTLEG